MKTDLVVCGYLFHDNNVLLIHHKKLNLWLPPGGHIDKDETPDEALKREFLEELNLKIEILNRNDVPMVGNIKKLLAVPFHVNVHDVGDHDHCCLFYVCKSENIDDLTLNTSEIKDSEWFSIEELQNEKVPEDVRSVALKAFDLLNKLSE